MLFQIKKLKQFLSSVSKYKIEKIDIKSKTLKLTINTIKSTNTFFLNKPKNYNKVNINEIITNKNTKKKNNTLNKEQGKYFTIVSPMIGTFYRSPAPNEAPFMEINDIVTMNQTVCIIEAMKLMNEIESEVNGQIAEILVQDGDIVDCGQALIRIKQDL